jgi:FkbM family methyltransferase
LHLFHGLAEDIGTVDVVSSRIRYLKKGPSLLINIWRAYRNPREILQHLLGNKYPVKAILKNGTKLNLNSEREIWYNMLSINNLLCGKDYAVQYSENEKGVATIFRVHEREKEVARIYNSINNGDVWGIFVKDEYRLLPVANKIVLDVGANIADSSIYFIIQGARNVFALEPFPKNYQIASENITKNKLSDRIFLSLAGCAGDNKKITIESDLDSNMLSQLHPTKSGLEVPLFSLEHILDSNALTSDIVLKMDCEGCEYDSVLSAPREVLKRFKYVHIEYHYGYKSLKNKLVQCGFNVTVNRPTYWGPDSRGKPRYAGDILGINTNL